MPHSSFFGILTEENLAISKEYINILHMRSNDDFDDLEDYKERGFKDLIVSSIKKYKFGDQKTGFVVSKSWFAAPVRNVFDCSEADIRDSLKIVRITREGDDAKVLVRVEFPNHIKEEKIPIETLEKEYVLTFDWEDIPPSIQRQAATATQRGIYKDLMPILVATGIALTSVLYMSKSGKTDREKLPPMRPLPAEASATGETGPATEHSALPLGDAPQQPPAVHFDAWLDALKMQHQQSREHLQP